MAALTLLVGLLCVQQADEIHFSTQVGKVKIRSLAQNSIIIMKMKSPWGPELDTAGQSTQSEVRAQPSHTAGSVRLHDVGFIGFYIPPRHVSKFGTHKEYQGATDTKQSWQKPQVGNFSPLIIQNNQSSEIFLSNTQKQTNKQINK